MAKKRIHLTERRIIKVIREQVRRVLLKDSKNRWRSLSDKVMARLKSGEKPAIVFGAPVHFYKGYAPARIGRE